MISAPITARGWLKGMVLQSQSMYEAAAGVYHSVLGTQHLDQENAGNLQNMEPVTVESVVQRLTDCYVRIGDWAALELWMEQLRVLRTKHQNLASSLALPYDSNALQAWVYIQFVSELSYACI